MRYFLIGGGVLALAVVSAIGQQPAPRPPAAVLTQYCVTCHNARLKTGGLAIDPAEAARPAEHAEMWEKVIHKLRANAMPPAGAPKPDAATLNGLAAYFETELDRAATARPQPGKLPPFHRLTRTEYQNAIRDLLALKDLPKEFDYSLLLPADNTSSGFDNLADLLFLSPSVMERYLDAARKISRLALGDPNAPVIANMYRMHPEHWQDERVEDLPFGTRGGLAIRSEFPLDGEYVVKVDLAAAPREPTQLEISVDGLDRLGRCWWWRAPRGGCPSHGSPHFSESRASVGRRDLRRK
jgi:mono/diheme cytochrome c family protein